MPAAALRPETLARAVVAGSAAVAVTGLALMAVNAGTPLPAGTDWRFAHAGALGFLGCGALLATRLPRSALSWVVLAVGVTMTLAHAANEYAILALVTAPADGLPAGAWAQWLGQWVWMPGYLLLVTLVVLLFPDGRLPSLRWRPLVPLTALLLAGASAGFAVTPWDALGEPVVAPHAANPVAVPWLADTLAPAVLLTIPCAALAVASLVVRLRRADGAERRQLAWFGAGVAAAAALLAAGQAVDGAGPIALALALGILPAAVAVAVLRHGRWLGDQLVGELRVSRERIVSAREEERRRLRADLHDEVGPSLAVLALRLDAAAADSPQADVLRELAGQARGTLTQVRRIVHDLRPAALADLGLEAALAEAVRQVDGTRLGVRLEVRGALRELPAAVEVAAYRIAREALANVVRHADARGCAVRLERRADGSVVVAVEDDGRGLGGAAARGRRGGLGLASMAERADELGGTLTIAVPLGGGTRVEAVLPA